MATGTLPKQKVQKIIHIDMDCFFAAIEMRDNPSLRDVPLAIGGRSKRGVLSTCNYKAREFGLRSAMPTSVAKRLCPRAIFISGDMDKYVQESRKIKEIISQVTDKAQFISIDEAYLDVSDYKSATLIAEKLRCTIFKETGLTASAGVAPNKFLAKIGSDWNKPNGLTVIPPEKINNFLKNLPVQKIPGVGTVTFEKLKRLGVSTCFDLRKLDYRELLNHFGKFGPRLHEYAYGIDNRPVSTDYIRKSLSVEKTFLDDIEGLRSCKDELPLLLDEVLRRFNKWKEKNGVYPISKGFIKIKYNDFTSTTIEKIKTPDFFNDVLNKGILNQQIIDYFNELLFQAYNRSDRPIRLLGVGFRFLENDIDKLKNQINFFDYISNLSQAS